MASLRRTLFDLVIADADIAVPILYEILEEGIKRIRKGIVYRSKHRVALTSYSSVKVW